MNVEHFVWTKVQVPLYESVIMSKVILFWRTALLTRDISVFRRKDRLCWLSFKACWVNLVRASMSAITSSGPMAKAKMVAK